MPAVAACIPPAIPAVSRVLLTNDDGIDAPGLAVLEEAAREIAREVWVVAPERDQSGTSHSISLHAPLRVHQRGPRRFSIAGTPGDCVVMAVRHLMKDAPPDAVLSGINRGANLGIETMFSGTVGAAMTGLLLGLPSIALSQTWRDPERVRWDTARALAPDVLRRLLTIGDTPGDTAGGTPGGVAKDATGQTRVQADAVRNAAGNTSEDAPGNTTGRAAKRAAPVCLNVNFPDIDAAAAGPLTPTRQGRGIVQRIDVVPQVDPRGLAYHWLRFQRGTRENAPDSETTVVGTGRISVTPLGFERTDERAFAALERALRGDKKQ